MKKAAIFFCSGREGMFTGKHDSKVITFRLQQNPRPGVHDGVLIAVDAEKNYLSAEQENVLVPIKEKGKKDLTE